MLEQKSRGGRPGHAIKPGERVPVGLRVTPAFKRRLVKAAEEMGRSQSQEAEIRLERSFDRQDLLLEALDLAYGRPIAGLLQLLGQAMKNAANRQAHRSAHEPVPPGNEILVPEAMDQALNAAKIILTWARAAAAKPSTGNLGEVVAVGLLDWIEGRSGPDRTGWSTQITERLAPLIGKVPSEMISEGGGQ